MSLHLVPYVLLCLSLIWLTCFSGSELSSRRVSLVPRQIDCLLYSRTNSLTRLLQAFLLDHLSSSVLSFSTKEENEKMSYNSIGTHLQCFGVNITCKLLYYQSFLFLGILIIISTLTQASKSTKHILFKSFC